MPDEPAADYLIDYLFRIGTIDGDKAIGWELIGHWESRMGIELTPWESETLVEMSRAYLNEMHVAKDRTAKPPFAGAAKQWRWVQNEITERSLDRFLK